MEDEEEVEEEKRKKFGLVTKEYCMSTCLRVIVAAECQMRL